jgi:hypothetical protein
VGDTWVIVWNLYLCVQNIFGMLQSILLTQPSAYSLAEIELKSKHRVAIVYSEPVYGRSSSQFTRGLSIKPSDVGYDYQINRSGNGNHLLWVFSSFDPGIQT